MSLDDSSCQNLTNNWYININDNDLVSISELTSSQCCLSCLNMLSCQQFLYQTNSSICYLKIK